MSTAGANFQFKLSSFQFFQYVFAMHGILTFLKCYTVIFFIAQKWKCLFVLRVRENSEGVRSIKNKTGIDF